MENHKKVLIIDDEVDLAQMTAFQFQSKGFEVQVAHDGLEALQKVHVLKPHLIVLDINMPRMGGIEFYSKICGPDGRPLYPVLVLTARANIQGLFQDLEIDGFMIKPFEVDHLVHEAEVIIKRHNQAAPHAKLMRPGAAHKICLVDQDQRTFDQLACLFLHMDHMVIPAKSGAMAIERMMSVVPDIAAVHLGLTDIPGDVVIFRLSQMSKTMDVKFILYTSRHNAEHDRQVLDRLSAKTGIWTLVEYDHVQEIAEAVQGVLNEGEIYGR